MIPLPERPEYYGERRRKLLDLLDATRANPPRDLASVVREELKVDLSTSYGGVPVAHPFGKGSGQLSFKLNQVEADVAAGISFIVLKTVIAEDPDGARSMEEWAVPESKMKVEPRAGPEGRSGWTVTWEGRGWSESLAEYLELYAASLDVARPAGVPVAPSVKFHLPGPGTELRHEEYRHTVERLLEVHREHGCGGEMIVEKDFSPTLAGDPRASDPAVVREWLRAVPAAIHRAGEGRVRLGVKLMNALFGGRFQLEMVKTVRALDPAPAFLVVFNRLFDPARRVAYGGWELSYRNLEVLDALRAEGLKPGPLSATGNICSGKMMLEYARRGCENGQLHTFFQVPLQEYTATGGSRTARALHTLLFHPECGLVAWLWHLHRNGRIPDHDGLVRFRDVVEGALP